MYIYTQLHVSFEIIGSYEVKNMYTSYYCYEPKMTIMMMKYIDHNKKITNCPNVTHSHPLNDLDGYHRTYAFLAGMYGRLFVTF